MSLSLGCRWRRCRLRTIINTKVHTIKLLTRTSLFSNFIDHFLFIRIRIRIASQQMQIYQTKCVAFIASCQWQSVFWISCHCVTYNEKKRRKYSKNEMKNTKYKWKLFILCCCCCWMARSLPVILNVVNSHVEKCIFCMRIRFASVQVSWFLFWSFIFYTWMQPFKRKIFYK